MANGDNYPVGKVVVDVVPHIDEAKWQSMIEMLGIRTITTVTREFSDSYCTKETTIVEHQRIGGSE